MTRSIADEEVLAAAKRSARTHRPTLSAQPTLSSPPWGALAMADRLDLSGIGQREQVGWV